MVSFSFLSSLAFPIWSSIPATIGSYIPENIQKRLVGYLLQRTLGSFVKRDGLELDGIEAAIEQGRIRLSGLQIDTDSVNASLPADSPYRLRNGQLDVIDISLPFPNLWSGPLFLGISTIHLSFELHSLHRHQADPDEPHGTEEWNLDKSLHNASSDFVRTVLDPADDEQLQESLNVLGMKRNIDLLETDIDPFNVADPSEEEDFIPQAPGGFPSDRGALQGPEGQPVGSARMIEGLVEALLARLQVSIGNIEVHLHHEFPDTDCSSDRTVDLTLKMDGIRYALSQGHESELPRKTLTFDDIGLWMTSVNGTSAPAGAESPLSSDTRDTTGIDMMMSLGVADLRQSRMGIASTHDTPPHPSYGPASENEEEQNLQNNCAESLYQSAIGDAASSDTLPPPRIGSPSDDSVKKIFGLERKGIVFQMWKEMEGTEREKASTARISVDLGHLTAVIDTGQIESLIRLAGALSSSVASSFDPSAHSVSPAPKQSSTFQLQVSLSQLDLHYVYPSAVFEASSTATSWSRSEIGGRNDLHLSFRGLEVVKQSGEKTVATLSACSLSDIYRQMSGAKTEVRRQPLLQMGSTHDDVWLPAAADTKHAIDRLESSTAEALVSVMLTHSGTITQIGDIHVYLDPVMIDRMRSPLFRLSRVFSDTFPSTAISSKDRTTRNPPASDLQLQIRSASARMYSPHRLPTNDGIRRARSRIGLNMGSIHLGRLEGDLFQAKLDWIQADLGELTADDPLTWMTCGTVDSEDTQEKALDIRYAPSRSKRISMVVSSLSLDVNQPITHQLQYFADDWISWLDIVSADTARTSKEDSRLTDSRFLTQEDASSESASIASDDTIAEASSVECIVLEAVLSVRTDVRIVRLTAYNIDAVSRSSTGSKKGNVVDCTIFSVGMSETLTDNRRPVTILRSDLRGKARTGVETRPVLVVTILSTQEPVTGYKGTIVDLNLSNTFASISPGLAWVADMKAVLSSPPDVFSNMVPSDSMKVTLAMQDCSALMPATNRFGGISVDIGHCLVKTRLLASSTSRTLEVKLADIAISLSDNFRALVADGKQSERLVEDGDFALFCKLKESEISVSSHAGHKVKIELSHAVIEFSICADTLEILQDILRDISVGWASKPINQESPSVPASEIIDENGSSSDLQPMLGSLSDISPSAAASSFEEDLLHDDLPSNPKFVTKASRSKGKRPSWNESAEVGIAYQETITIVSRKPFDLYQDYLANLEESNLKSDSLSTSPLLVVGGSISIRILLFGGYDWQSTRSAIESETDLLRRRLRKLSQLISTGNAPPPELRRTNVELFNSIHIGIQEDDEFQDDEQLLAAIESELADLDSETASHTTYQPNMFARSNAGLPRVGHGNWRKLRRSRRPQMEFSLQDIAFRYSEEGPGEDIAGTLKFTVERAEIIDHIKSSTWKSFMTEMRKSGINLLGETGAKMVRVLVKWVNPGLQQATEARVSVEIAPLQFHIDQDALDFMKAFFSFSRKGESVSAETKDRASSRSKGFIQHVEIQPVQVKMDYKPRRLNLKALQRGSTMEVINLFHFESATMTLRHVTINGVSGWGELYSQLLSIWTPDVKANQMSDLLTGIAPVRSMVKAGSGVADLILLPLEQYRKDGKIVKGMRRGASSFATNTLSEVATIGAQLATGTQVILEKAERALGGRETEEARLPDMMESINLSEYEAAMAGKKSRYADQPANLNQGITAAYTSLASNLTSAAQTILAIPMEVIEETGSHQSATRKVIRAVPIAVLQGMIGITDAGRKTLFGVKNQLDPKNKGDIESKYKRR